MKTATSSAPTTTTTVGEPGELELADGTRLVPEGEARPARLEGDATTRSPSPTSQREDAEPFAGYSAIAASASA